MGWELGKRGGETAGPAGTPRPIAAANLCRATIARGTAAAVQRRRRLVPPRAADAEAQPELLLLDIWAIAPAAATAASPAPVRSRPLVGIIVDLCLGRRPRPTLPPPDRKRS